MATPDEIIICNIYYSKQEHGRTEKLERFLLIKNNKIYVETTNHCNGNAKTRQDILHIDFEIDTEYIENLRILLFGVFRRNEVNKNIYKNHKPIPQYPIIWIGENIVDFITPIKLYNELYLLNANMRQQLIKKDAEVFALKHILEEKDEIIRQKQGSSTFSLDKLVGYSLEDDDEFIEATWP